MNRVDGLTIAIVQIRDGQRYRVQAIVIGREAKILLRSVGNPLPVFSRDSPPETETGSIRWIGITNNADQVYSGALGHLKIGATIGDMQVAEILPLEDLPGGIDYTRPGTYKAVAHTSRTRRWPPARWSQF